MEHKLHPHLNQLERSATLAINERSIELAAAGQAIYRFGFGQSPFPVPGSFVSALQENAVLVKQGIKNIINWIND